MKKSTKKIAIALSIFMCLQPVMFAASDIYGEIAALEMELVKINTKAGEYADMSEKELEAKKQKTKKELEKKKAKAKKEFSKDKDTIKKGAKDVGKELKGVGEGFKEAGKDIGHTFKDIFSN